MVSDSNNPSADAAAPAASIVSGLDVSGSGVSGLGITLTNLSRTFPASSKISSPVKVLDALNLTIAPGSFVALLGPSGCGKSTLLRLIASLDKPTQGSITFTGQTQRRDGHHADIAYVFQDAHLLPWRNVWRNVALPLELMGVSKKERQAVAADALNRVGLSDALDRYPAQLSGGMRMRVSLARALVTQPRLLLLDEPFAALDEITRQQLDEQLRTLWRESGITVLFVTHSTAEATYLAQRAIVMSKRPATLIHDAPINLTQDRPRAIRGHADFAASTARIYEALERGEAKSDPINPGEKSS